MGNENIDVIFEFSPYKTFWKSKN